MSKKPSSKKTHQLLSSKITSVALCALATTLVVMVACKVLTPHAASLVTKAEPLTILADGEQEYAYNESYGGGDDATDIIHALSQQRNTQKQRIEELNSELASTKALVQKMKTQLMVGGGNQGHNKLKKHADDLAAQVKRGEAIASNYRNEIIERDALLAQQRQEFDKITRILGETNQSIQGQLHAIEADLRSEKEQNQQLVAAQNNEQKKINELRQQLSDSLATIEMMGNQIHDFKKASDQELLHHLQQENHTLNAELAQLHKQLASANDSTIEENTLIAMGDEEEPAAHLELQEQITQLEESNQRQNELIEILTVEVATANARALNFEALGNSEMIDEMQEELAQYEQLLDQAHQQLVTLSEEKSDIKSRQQEAVEALNSTIRTLQEENEQLLSRNEELQGFLQQEIQELAYIEREKADYQHQLEEVQQTPAIGELKNRLTNLSSRYSTEQKKCQRLEAELNAANQLLALLQEEVASTESNYDRSSPLNQARQSTYNNSMNKCKSKITQLTTRLAQEMKKTSAVEERLEEAQRRCRNLTDHNKELARENQAYADRHDYVEKVAALEKEVADEREMNRRTQRQLALMTANPSDYENLLATEEELRQHKVALASLQNEFNLLGNEYSNLKRANSNLALTYERTIEELNACNAHSLNSEALENAEVIDEMKEELAHYQRLLDQAHEQLANLSEENRYIEDRQQHAVEALNGTIHSLQEENQQLISRNEELANYAPLLDQTQQQLATLSEEKSDIEDRQQHAIEELNRTIHGLQEKNEYLLSRNEELKGYLGHAHQEIQELAYIERENVEYQHQLQEVQQTPAVEELKKQLTNISSHYSTEQKKCQRLEAELNTANRVLTALQEEIASTESSHNNSSLNQGRQPAYKSGINKFKSKVAQLTTRLAQEMRKTSAAEERLEEAQQRYRDLADHNRELARENRVEADRHNYVEEIALLQQELDSERETNRQIQRQLALVKTTSSNHENFLTVEEELRQHKVALVSLQNEFNLLANEYADLEAANNNLAVNYERTVEEFNTLLSEEETKTKMLIGDLEMLHEQYQAEDRSR